MKSQPPTKDIQIQTKARSRSLIQTPIFHSLRESREFRSLSGKKKFTLLNKRNLEIHYNLLFALANRMQKLTAEGYYQFQEEILRFNEPEKVFKVERLIDQLVGFIERNVDFKKIVNLICLINFTIHGFFKEHHERIILKVIENYHIRYVYILLKMDSYGFFVKRTDSLGLGKVTSRKLQNQYLEFKKPQNLSFASQGIDFSMTPSKTQFNTKRFSNFMLNQTLKNVRFFVQRI